MSHISCNPLDLPYRYQDVRFSGSVQGVKIGEPQRSVHREAADPSIVRYQGHYLLFASMSRGFWSSTDLNSWQFHPTAKLPPFDYAPDVREVDGTLIISASRKTGNSPFFRSRNPLEDDFEEIAAGTFAFWDPSVFQDNDGRIYLYWGCDAVQPLYGIELDRELTPIGEAVPLAYSDASSRGWERPGEDYMVPEPTTERERLVAQFSGASTYVEGAWMTRVGDLYYLQYSAPGTQWNTYADGYLTASSPLGPFTYSSNSPFSSKPGGFITGAGHGSTFQDEWGNWWHAATMRISVNDVFERRVGIFPAGFDEDGVLFCNQSFADYPMLVPEGAFDPQELRRPPWMLLSYEARTLASSHAEGHDSDLAVNEDVRSWWASALPGVGQWLTADLGEEKDVHAVQVNLGDHELAQSAPLLDEGADSGHTWRGIYESHAPAEVLLEGSIDGANWAVLHDGSQAGEDRPHALVVLDAPQAVRYIRVTAQSLPFDGAFAVSGLRVFGRGRGIAPQQIVPDVVRVDDRTASLTWEEADGAQGYNIRYGPDRDKLYRSWLVYGRTSLEVPTLNAGASAWFAVDSFNENGVTFGEPVQATAATLAIGDVA
ncbi:family 43 glycosylhydrolase [Microterricola viridarii]|uniref:Glycosyl hydrolases family 43 n=1 Tax=Microterricola viridarii TaxID=412690 RepID=A0A1H1VBX6_9MICO|nr:family 43 glycosylhydrolase [Microterricola viridarii]SDS81906.1 Glycosyl hydrolases family 43 [Microterricola viridarii]